MQKASTETGIRDLKTHLSAYLRRVKAGEMIQITDRGTTIAYIVPAQANDERSLEQKMQTLEEAGLLKWKGQRLPPHEPTVKVKGERLVSDLLLEDRR